VASGVTATDATLDAEARRITELYTKAVEQLGSEKAPVRLGGLYALERVAAVAQGDPVQRQTIVDVLCAYLRMPYTPPADRAPADDAPEPEQARFEQRTQERQVRLTAQRILATRLRPGRDPDHPAPKFWPDIDLDLTGATLIDFDLSDCRPDTALFDGAQFVGGARFNRATFVGGARFCGATFVGGAGFFLATFPGDAWFDGAMFAGAAQFTSATFTDGVFGGARFSGAQFAGAARFDAAVPFFTWTWGAETACWVRLDVPMRSRRGVGGRWGGWWCPRPSGPHPTPRARGADWCDSPPQIRPTPA
jgi:Pentapeptide repeats (9 copies)